MALESGWWFAFRGSDLLIDEGEAGTAIPTGAGWPVAELTGGSCHAIGEIDGNPCYAVALPADAQAPAGMTFIGLRPLYERVGRQMWMMAGRAVQILDWERTHRFCSACGVPTVRAEGEFAMRCPACGMLYYPRLAPAVIVLVRDGDRALLASHQRYAHAMYSTIAGFVEPGETLEEAVAREVAEEVGVQIKQIEYFGSQPWPFPHSLMVGFTAEYAGGEIRLQESEIADARWFRYDQLPQVPAPLSIARRLIDAFVASCRADEQA